MITSADPQSVSVVLRDACSPACFSARDVVRFQTSVSKCFGRWDAIG